MDLYVWTNKINHFVMGHTRTTKDEQEGKVYQYNPDGTTNTNPQTTLI